MALSMRSIIKTYSVRLHMEDSLRNSILLLWQLLMEMLLLFIEPTWPLDGVSKFLHKVEFQLTKLQENLFINCGGVCNFHFWRVLPQFMCKIWWFFPNSKRKKKTMTFPKNSPSGKHQICIFRSLKNLFSDFIKIEILFHKYSRNCVIHTYSSHAKKPIWSHLK